MSQFNHDHATAPMQHTGHAMPEEHVGHDKHEGHSPGMFKRKFWLTLVLTVPVLLYSETIQELLNFSMPAFSGSEWLPAVLGTVIFFYGGLVFLKGAKNELADRQPGMMTLISLAITVAFGYSLAVSLGFVEGMDFWWELATLIAIMLLGHWLEMASVMSAQGALKELAKLLPDEAELVTDGGTKNVPVGALKAGDLVLVRPGAQIPTDGEVARGESDVNESMLTGESKPVKKMVQSVVIGGTINGSGSLSVKVTKIGNDTTLAGIMKLVAEAQNSKSKTQILADRAAFYLTFVAIGAALITGIAWAIADESAGFILERIVTVLVIACPHALGLAVPLVTAISTTLAAKNGLLIRQRMALEAARNVDVILFDKTGTLTKGEQGVVDVVTDGNKKELLAIAAAIEAESEHPIARAIVKAAAEQKLQVPQVSSFSALAGRGAKATIMNRHIAYVGGPRLVEELQAQMPDSVKQAAARASTDGKTVVYVIDQEKKVHGAIMLADVIRKESREAIARLHKMGKRVAMLTGDSKGVAAWVAKELDIDEFFAEVLPENKAETVKKLQANGRKVAMVGDGVNDAPALTQADIGVAIGAGTDVAIESAGIVLASSDPRGVAKVVRLSQGTYRKMLQNLWWATGYNAIAIPLAAGITAALGFVLSPAIGAVLMSLSTIIVAINAQFLRKVKL
ncbi:MAG TPA: heavy metal translocating P-type ATPase [Candidatus Saccharimonadales bacterium]|nr:heavy metal translocating P-type ATPase [Candidatus Saccharimonadales bacterium]